MHNVGNPSRCRSLVLIVFDCHQPHPEKRAKLWHSAGKKRFVLKTQLIQCSTYCKALNLISEETQFIFNQIHESRKAFDIFVVGSCVFQKFYYFDLATKMDVTLLTGWIGWDFGLCICTLGFDLRDG